MKTKHFVLAIVFSLSVSCVTFADRQLEKAEISQIFEKLTSQSRKTWVPAGTIEAIHEEYRAPKTTNLNEISSLINEKVQEYQSNPNKRELTEELQKMKLDALPFNVRYRQSNRYTMNSNVTVRFDGNRFYWEIKVTSRTDSVKPDADLAGNFMTEQFDLGWNSRRIFAWDGDKYTTYFLPGNHAIVNTTGSTPHVINGPLTAGVIPWGYGYFTFSNLSAAESSAVEKNVDGETQIHLTINLDGSEMVFVMDPGKDYAVTSHSISDFDTNVYKEYGNYQLVSGNWVPTMIFIERYDARTNRLLSSDLWNFTMISGETPMPWSFNVEYEPDALIEYRSYVTAKPAMYHYSHMVDTDLLLAERLAFAASEGIQPQNCATVALKYTASQLGKDITNRQLAQLISGPDKTTSLYSMKQFAEGLGLYCRAVKLDIKTLQSLDGCEAILHIPNRNHFIVLGDIDDRYVFSIDLANNKFYYRTDVGFFGMDWTEGIALLISDNPIAGKFIDIDDGEIKTKIGGSGYSCTDLLQEYDVTFCSYAGGECWGYYEEYYTRYGCEYAPSGSCSAYRMVRYAESPCINDPYYPLACDITGEWTCYYIRACD